MRHLIWFVTLGVFFAASTAIWTPRFADYADQLGLFSWVVFAVLVVAPLAITVVGAATVMRDVVPPELDGIAAELEDAATQSVDALLAGIEVAGDREVAARVRRLDAVTTRCLAPVCEDTLTGLPGEVLACQTCGQAQKLPETYWGLGAVGECPACHTWAFGEPGGTVPCWGVGCQAHVPLSREDAGATAAVKCVSCARMLLGTPGDEPVCGTCFYPNRIPLRAG